MMFSSSNFLYALLFVAALFLVEGVYYLIADSAAGRHRALNRRLQMMGRESDARVVLRTLRREKSQGAILARLLPRLDRLIAQAGATMSVTRLLVIMGALWLAIFAVAKITLIAPLAIALALASAVAFVVPVGVLMLKRKKRLRRFGEQLPEVLDLIVRSLSAGHPLATALALVAKQMGDPIGTEFGILVDETTYGIGMDEALSNMSTRVPHNDLQLLIVTIQIQHYTGGNLAEVLSNLAKVIRDRLYMVKKVRAVSAEGRMSALVVGILPFGVTAFIMLVRPEFFRDVSADPLFVPMIAGGFVLLVLGQFWIWRIVNFRI